MGLFSKVARKMEKNKYDKELKERKENRKRELEEKKSFEGLDALENEEIDSLICLYSGYKMYAECVELIDELDRRGYKEGPWWLDVAVAVYFYGNGGVPRDSKKAAGYMLKAIESGCDTQRFVRMSDEVLLGIPSTRFSPKDAPDANFELMAYDRKEFERIVKKDVEYVGDWIRKACRAERILPEPDFYAIANFLLAYKAYEDLVKMGIWEGKRDIKSVEAMLLKEMEKDDKNSVAAHWLSVIYDTGLIKKEESEIVKLQIKAYNGNYPPAIHRLRNNYDRTKKFFNSKNSFAIYEADEALLRYINQYYANN